MLQPYGGLVRSTAVQCSVEVEVAAHDSSVRSCTRVVWPTQMQLQMQMQVSSLMEENGPVRYGFGLAADTISR